MNAVQLPFDKTL